MLLPDWNQIFTEHGRVFHDPHPDIPRIVSLFKEHDVKRVLDLGCGSGRHLVVLSKLGFEMFGFDASPKALAMSKEWLDEEGLSAELITHLMQEPFPYDSEFFDAVLSFQVIHHNLMKDILATVAEIERILRPGGVIFISVPVLQEGPVAPYLDWDLKQVEDGTYIPQAGPESGIPHHYFLVDEIREVFNTFDILDIYLDDSNHRCIIGIKKQ
jgi:SAM-dependent methyltransferase